MSENFKLDINIPQKDIEKMAKQVIQGIIEERIEDTMSKIDVETIIESKVKGIESKINKLTEKVINKKADDLIYTVQYDIKGIIRKVILEEIQKKPLTGNVYLKLDNSNIETDYDNDDWK